MDFSAPKIMGILNLTPDSFSDGGDFVAENDWKLQLERLMKDGADIIDIGGESTGPGSKEVTPEEEMARVKPVIDYVAEKKLTEKLLFSIDTYKAPVARYALQNGFQIVNDVTALRGDPGMPDVLLEYEPYIILMYSKDKTPRTTSETVVYDDIVATVKSFLIGQMVDLIEAGFPEEKIILDPGMGMFISADPKYSFQIIDRLSEIKQLGYPLLIGVSRKSFLGGKLEERENASVEWSLKAIENGADIVRMHEVSALKKALTDLSAGDADIPEDSEED